MTSSTFNKPPWQATLDFNWHEDPDNYFMLRLPAIKGSVHAKSHKLPITPEGFEQAVRLLRKHQELMAVPNSDAKRLPPAIIARVLK